MRTEIKFITPALAGYYLKNNNNNRTINERTVRFYADEMIRGQWKLTGQGISFDDNNNLIDGQHRLRAIIKSGISVQMLVIFGVDSSTFEVYDTGKIRSVNDVFSIRGIPNAVSITAGIKNYYNFKEGRKDATRSIRETKRTNIDIVQEYYKNEELWQNLYKYAAKLYDKYRIYSPSLLIGFISYLKLEKKHTDEDIFTFIDSLYNIKNIDNITPSTLREILIKDALSNRKIKNTDKIMLLILAWNYYLKGKSVKTIRFDLIDYSIEIL